MRDHHRGFEFPDVTVGIAEIDGNYRDARSLGRVDVRLRVAHHDGSRRVASGLRDRLEEVARIRLAKVKGIGAADGRKAILDAQCCQQPLGESLRLVRANRQPKTRIVKPGQGVDHPGVRLRAAGNVAAVMLQEQLEKPIVMGGIKAPAVRQECPLDHDSAAVPNVAAEAMMVGRWHAARFQAVVEAVEEIGSGVDQCSVEIENDNRLGHEFPLARREAEYACPSPMASLRRVVKAARFVGDPEMIVVTLDEQKVEAARQAMDLVRSGMRIGIGTGSTAEAFVRILAERVAQGLSIRGVPTSERTARFCRDLRVPLVSLDDEPELDLAIDGADEITPDLSLIKGGGGALLREKIVAAAAKRFVVIADAAKLVSTLGRFPLPVEVIPFGCRSTEQAIRKAAEELGLDGPVRLRLVNGEPFLTDGGHFVLDASFGRIPNPRALSQALHAIPGVVEHGLFLGMAKVAIVADAEGAKSLEVAQPGAIDHDPR